MQFAVKGNLVKMYEIYQKFYSDTPSSLLEAETIPNLKTNQKFYGTSEGVSQKTIDKYLADIGNCKSKESSEFIERKLKRLAQERRRSSVPLQLLGALYQKQGLIQKAIESFTAAFRIQRDNPDIASNLGTCFYQTNNFSEAEKYFQIALKGDSNNERYHLKIAFNFFKKNDYSKSYEHFKSALKINPKYVDALCGLGELLSADLKVNEATKCYELALKIDPSNYGALTHLTIQYASKMRFSEALKLNDRAEIIIPGATQNKINRANIYLKSGELDKAETIYSDIKPDSVLYGTVLFGKSSINYKKGNVTTALEQITEAILREPTNSSFVNFKGVCLDTMKRYDDAQATYKEALELNEKNVSAATNLANILSNEGHLEEALELYSKAFIMEPTNNLAGTNVFSTARKLCDWARASVATKKIENNGLKKNYVQPWIYFQLEDNPEKQMLRSMVFSNENYSHISQRKKSNKEKNNKGKIKVGYFSADFHNHATYFLISGLLRCHDKSKFEIHLFSYGSQNHSKIQQELKNSGHFFHNISSKTDNEVLQFTDSICLDIAIDLKGFTKDNRVTLFAHRLAPTQVSFLGYPGTTGADFLDYMVADRTTIPVCFRKYYSEKIIFLPNCYQPNDDQRVIASELTTREAWNLPEEAIILCCFNQVFKITKDEIEIWASILRKNPKAIIWLLDSHETAKRNIKAAFRKRGVDVRRVVFAPFASQAEHLERLRHADLFLDTFFVNAHTSASDALWAGVPVITKCGNQFAARVAASLLHAVGMEKLVAIDDKEYEEKILYHIENTEQIKSLKAELAVNVKNFPLFDTTRYTKNFENALKQIFLTEIENKRPKDVYITE